MNLNDEKNLLLAKKGVYAEQLYFYSKLCETYGDLAEIAIEKYNLNPNDIEQRYAKPLAQIISSTDIPKTLDELKKEYRFIPGTNLSHAYSPKEIELFSSFAKNSEKFKNFKRISSFLDEASMCEDSNSREAVLSKMHNYMNNPRRPNTIHEFDKLISNHSPRFLGSRFFLLASNGIKNIKNVDYTHIPIPYSVKLETELTPEKFGATLSVPELITKNIKKLEENLDYDSHYNPDNWNLDENLDDKTSEAQNEYNTIKNSFEEKKFVIGSKISNKYHAHKSVLKRAAYTALAVATLIGGGGQIAKEIKAHNLGVNSQTNYEQTISNNTKEYLDNIIKDLDLQKDSFDPQKSDVKDIESRIDLVLDYIIKDQVTTAFEDYHKDYQVTDVSTWFDLRYQDNSGEKPYEFVTVTYLDENGKEGKENISNFKSEFLTSNSLYNAFNVEEEIDLNSPIANAFEDDGTKNFLQKAKDIQEVMDYLENAVEQVQNIAAFGIEHGHTLIFKEPYLKSVLPDEKQNDDDER